MFGIFRAIAQSTQAQNFLRRPIQSKMNFRAGFHTTKSVAAVNPVAKILRAVTFLASRDIRKWWITLPKDKRQFFWVKLKQQKWIIAGRFFGFNIETNFH